MIGMPALLVGHIGTIVMLYVSGRSSGVGDVPDGRHGRPCRADVLRPVRPARKISWGEQEKNRRSYLRPRRRTRRDPEGGLRSARPELVHSNPQTWVRSSVDRRCGSAATRPGLPRCALGVGVQHAPDSVLSVQWPEIPIDEELEPVTGRALRDFILEQRKIRDIAKVVNLRSRPGFSFVGEDLTGSAPVRSVLSGLAVFHNPLDVKLLVVTRHPELWSWMVWLPHNQHDELFDACGRRRLVFTGPTEFEDALGADLHRKGRGPWRPPSGPSRPPWARRWRPTRTARPGAALGDRRRQHRQSRALGERGRPVGKEGITVLRVASRLGPVSDSPTRPNDRRSGAQASPSRRLLRRADQLAGAR